MEKDEEEHKEEKKVDYSRRKKGMWKEEGERSSRYLVNIQHTRIKQGKEDVRSNKLLRVL